LIKYALGSFGFFFGSFGFFFGSPGFFLVDSTRVPVTVKGTMTLMEIKEEVLPMLTFEEKAELTRAIWEYDDWDLQMIEGCKPGGAFDKLRNEAIAEDERGETEVWP